MEWYFIFLAQVAPPPEGFYYLIATLFGAGLLYAIRSFVVTTNLMLKQLTDSVTGIQQILAVHEHRHKALDLKEANEGKMNSEIFSEMMDTLNNLNDKLDLLNYPYQQGKNKR